MDNPLNLPPGSVQPNFGSAFYARKPGSAATAASLSQALPLWPPVPWPTLMVRKHHMPFPTQPAAKKLQVRRLSPVLSQDLPLREALQVAELPPPRVQLRPLQQAPPVLKQSLPKTEVPAVLPVPVTSVGLRWNARYPWNETSCESTDRTSTRKQCKCKNSKCLKKYCECFASGGYCNDCNCKNCYNNVGHEAARQDAIDAAMERNPMAFMPKIGNIPPHAAQNRERTANVWIARTMRAMKIGKQYAVSPGTSSTLSMHIICRILLQWVLLDHMRLFLLQQKSSPISQWLLQAEISSSATIILHK
ncbi:hypothetical protein ACQJBY_018881 [Aegilops geniculata]